MRRIVCDECKRPYDFDRDDFCPRCGAFNPPVKTWSTDAQGNVIRVDGINEQTHAGSFVHREVHREKQVRKVTGLDRRPQSPKAVRQPAPQSRPPQPPRQNQPKNKWDNSAALQILAWMIGVVVFATVVLPFLFALL